MENLSQEEINRGIIRNGIVKRNKRILYEVTNKNSDYEQRKKYQKRNFTNKR